MMSLSEYFRHNVFCVSHKYKWLVKRLDILNVKIHKIADFGCGEGWETLALMCLFNGREAAGIDKDHHNIESAQGNVRHIQSLIWANLAKGVSVPNDSPCFLVESQDKRHLEQTVRFYTGDITKPTPLRSDYYDIAFCNFVLKDVWLHQGGEPGIQNAIEEIARVVKPSGFVAAREPTKRTSETDEPAFHIDFGPLFEGVGLSRVYMENETFESGQNTEYLYAK